MKNIIFTLMVVIFTLQLSATRIVSLSPAITEIIFALGKGDQIVGNTRFCDYPAAASEKSKIGGYLDMNIELIASLTPDIIFHYPEHLSKLKPITDQFQTISLNHTDINSIFQSITTIAKTLKAESEGRKLISSIKSRLAKISSTSRAGKPKVLMIAGRNPDKLDRMYIVGNGDFLNELLEISGGINAYQGKIQYPAVSVESIFRMKPDYIIDLAVMNHRIPVEEVFKLWKRFKITDNPEKQILIIKDNFWVRPGPRIAQIAETMYNFIQKR